jgi:hypothetical protein
MNAVVHPVACIYCGRPAEEDDHVPPQCLFPRPRPPELVTVPACSVCNRKFGFDDEYFRDAFVLSSIETEGLPELETLRAAVKRSLTYKKFQPPARKMLMRAQRGWHPWRSAIAERVMLLPINMRRIGATVERIVKGLHFHETGRVLPATHTVGVVHGSRLRTIPSYDRVHFQRLFAPLETAQFRVIGGRAFGYRFAQAEDDPDSGIWFLSFFGCLTFFCFTSSD